MKRIFSLLVILLLIGCAKEAVQESQQEAQETPQVINQPQVEAAKVQPTNLKEFNIVARQWSFEPSEIRVNQGDLVKLTIKSIDVKHGFALEGYQILKELNPGETVTVEFTADRVGTFVFRCFIFCGSGHAEMSGELTVT